MKNRKIKDSGLELRIDLRPENRNQKFLENYDKISDETLVIDNTYLWWARPLLIIYFCTLGAFISHFMDVNNFDIFDICLIISAYSVCLYPVVIALDPTKKKIILDRKNGEITFPERFPVSCVGYFITIPFSDVKLGIRFRGTAHYNIGLRLAILYPNGQNRTVIEGNATDAFAFFVWYMDKNRPLPPGELFDRYRQKDFERRKAEGFPPPLYPSSIPTPEATPEQQKERERYWKG